jgi:hypothetical protein
MSFADQRGVKNYKGVKGATIGNGLYPGNLPVTGPRGSSGALSESESGLVYALTYKTFLFHGEDLN